MSKIYKIIIFAVLLISITNMSFATEEIIKSQLETLNISSLIESGNKYINENFSEMDVNDLLNQALTGSIDKNILYKSLLKVLGNEFISGITIISTIIAIIIIHSIIKSISEKKHIIEMSLFEGKNREIRRICEYFNLIVNKLQRISYENFSLNNLSIGELKQIPEEKVSILLNKYLKKEQVCWK